ncbi:uncharacterized protein LOC132814206 isoform X2 [Hemiscyllium ocellatum]|uniref:uncharacterized protein LOC132809340 isoform X2 n=1 Tax=Hemiscyllium ocellatum TaxID=170820 RepID=UPI00296726AF|nr:uncharacterized protein LOC132809340 isoform X2 [Hemiscyllium ocellatum]XP_060679134.1 uncharacterized protein LOC132813429 isoform X1 [Hemiscyllium ocellatum]XP_060679409.1 uncharacterized protein LOC132814206 isoform X2 [Hemiscyllium ocellatum]
MDITHRDGVPQEIKLFLINNGNVSQDQVEDNDQEIRRCHGSQEYEEVVQPIDTIGEEQGQPIRCLQHITQEEKDSSVMGHTRAPRQYLKTVA